jgi:predicted ester cyclase
MREHLREGERTAAQERNLAAVAAWVDGYNAQDFATLELLAAADFRVDDPASGTEIAGWGAFLETARRVAQTYPDRRITVTRMLPLGDSAVAVQGVWDATAAADASTGVHRGDEVHHVESMVVEFVDGKIAHRRIYR